MFFQSLGQSRLGRDTHVSGISSIPSSLAASLRARGFDVFVVDVERKDWAKILGGLLSVGFWTQKSTSDPAYTWYIERLDATVRRALAAHPGATQVDLVCHSAGGWLAKSEMSEIRPSSKTPTK